MDLKLCYAQESMTKEQMNERTSQKQYAPQLFQSWGHNKIMSISQHSA